MEKHHWYLLSLIMAAELVSGFETSMVLAAIGAWLRIYGDPVKIGWIVSSYLLVSAAIVALCGRLGDMFGRKRVLVAVIVLAAIGSCISALGPTLNWIIGGRAIQGFAGAILPLCFGLAREYFPPRYVSIAIGFLTATAAAGAGVGLLVGGILTDLFGPQSIFVASAVLAFVVSIMVGLGLPASKRSTIGGKIDWLGGILFAPAVTALLLAISNGRTWGWASLEFLAVLVFGLVMLAYWAWHETRQETPLIDVRLLLNRRCAFANAVMCCSALGVMQLTQLASMLLQQPTWTLVGLGTSATLVGFLKFPALIAGVISSITSGWVAGRRGGQLPMLAGCLLMFGGCVLGALAHGSVALIVLILLIGQLGVTATFTGIPSVIVGAVPDDRTSEATGLSSVVRAISQAIGAQVLVVLLATTTMDAADGTRYPDEQAYTLVFWCMALVSGLGMVLSFVLGSKRSQPAEAIANR